MANSWISNNFADAPTKSGDFNGRTWLETPGWLKDATIRGGNHQVTIKENSAPDDRRAALTNVSVLDADVSGQSYGTAIMTGDWDPGMELFLSDVYVEPDFPFFTSYDDQYFKAIALKGPKAVYAEDVTIRDWNNDAAFDTNAPLTQLVNFEVSGPGQMALRFWREGEVYIVDSDLSIEQGSGYGDLIWTRYPENTTIYVYNSTFNGSARIPQELLRPTDGSRPEVVYLDEDPRNTGELHPMFGGDSGGNTDPAPAPAPEPEPEPAPEPDSSPQQPTEGGEIGEWGYISGVTHQPQTISLARSYDDPVVFVGPLSFNGGQEAVARITATTDDSFTVMAQEPGSLDGVHLAESLGYLVVERGTWSLADGTRLEIGEIQSDRQSNGGFERVDFNTNFDATPTVLSQVQTFNDGDFVTTRQSGPSSNGVDLTMQGEEADSNVSRGTETIGYLAIEQGSGSLGGRDFEARTTGNNFDDGSTFAGFSSQIDQSPTLLASLASFNGRDPAVLRHSSLGADGATLTVQEDQSYDGEVTHVDEQVSLLVFDGTSGTLTGDALV